MTTLAWDGKEMAADSQSTSGSLVSYTVKIFKTDTYIMAFSGAIDEGYMFKAILDDEMKAKDCRFTKGFTAMVWHDDGTMEEYFDTMVPVPVTDKYVASGNGIEIAMAAMHCGKTAREAVELAKKLNIYTGGKIISYSWENIKKKGKKKKNESLPTDHSKVEILPVSGGPEQA